MNKEELAKYIDQTLLTPSATSQDVEDFCKKSLPYGFASICIQPVFVSLVHSILSESSTKVCTVIDFPHGASSTKSKCLQAECAIKDGAEELDFVISLSLVKAHKWAELEAELLQIVKSVKSETENRVLLKLILETSLLTDEEIEKSSVLAKSSGFDFVKTSTGFAKSTGNEKAEFDAKVRAVTLMRKTVGENVGVKASGGIHTTEEALTLISAGASRIGASSGIAIVDGLK